MEKEELIQQVASLEREIETLKGINESNKTWLALLSHDFKGVFANLIWVINLYKSNALSSDMVLKMFPELEANANKNLKALDDTFLAAKIQLGEISRKNEKISFKELYNDLLDLFSDNLHKKGLVLEFRGDEDIVIESNRLILRSVLIKIIDNAIKYSFRDNKIVFAIDVINSERVRISVEDFGVGMDDYTFSKVFCLDGAAVPGTEGEKGTGLGLVLSREALRFINGTIEIDSVKGKGTLVNIVV